MKTILITRFSSFTGTSSFGLSGVNAHLLLTAPPTVAVQPPTPGGLPWASQRYWPAPAACALLTAHVPSSLPFPATLPTGGSR